MEERAVSWLSMPTEIQQQVYRCLFESVNIIVWLSPQPYTTPMGRGVKTVTNFPQDNSYFAPLLVCRKMYENARKFKRYAALTIEAREYTHSPHLEHLRRAIREQPQISRLFRDCTRIVLWGGDGEFFSRLRHDLPSLQTLRLANIEVDSPLSQIAPRLAFESLEELSTFLTGSWTVHDNEKLAEYEELLRPKGALAAAACLEAFTGQDFAHTASNVVSLDGLTVEVVIFRAEYYSITGTEGEALLVSPSLVHRVCSCQTKISYLMLACNWISESGEIQWQLRNCIILRWNRWPAEYL